MKARFRQQRRGTTYQFCELQHDGALCGRCVKRAADRLRRDVCVVCGNEPVPLGQSLVIATHQVVVPLDEWIPRPHALVVQDHVERFLPPFYDRVAVADLFHHLINEVTGFIPFSFQLGIRRSASASREGVERLHHVGLLILAVDRLKLRFKPELFTEFP